jgi:hypothetical protein
VESGKRTMYDAMPSYERNRFAERAWQRGRLSEKRCFLADK